MIRGAAAWVIVVAVLVVGGVGLTVLADRTPSPEAGALQATVPSSPAPAARRAIPADPPTTWLRERGEATAAGEDRADTSGDGDPQERSPTTDRAASVTDAPARASRTTETIEERGEAALARIGYPWQDLGFTIRFEPARDGLRGVTYNSRREIHLFVRLSDPVERTAHDLAHEIGHAVDLVHMDRERRRSWLDARGARGTEWWTCDYCEDRAHGSGDFAEVFALSQVGPTYFSSQLAARPSDRELERLRTFFRPGDRWRRHYGSPDDDDEEESEGIVICVVNCG